MRRRRGASPEPAARKQCVAGDEVSARHLRIAQRATEPVMRSRFVERDETCRAQRAKSGYTAAYVEIAVMTTLLYLIIQNLKSK